MDTNQRGDENEDGEAQVLEPNARTVDPLARAMDCRIVAISLTHFAMNMQPLIFASILVAQHLTATADSIEATPAIANQRLEHPAINGPQSIGLLIGDMQVQHENNRAQQNGVEPIWMSHWRAISAAAQEDQEAASSLPLLEAMLLYTNVPAALNVVRIYLHCFADPRQVVKQLWSISVSSINAALVNQYYSYSPTGITVRTSVHTGSTIEANHSIGLIADVFDREILEQIIRSPFRRDRDSSHWARSAVQLMIMVANQRNGRIITRINANLDNLMAAMESIGLDRFQNGGPVTEQDYRVLDQEI